MSRTQNSRSCTKCMNTIGDVTIEHDGQYLCMDCFVGGPQEEIEDEPDTMEEVLKSIEMESLTCNICVNRYNNKSRTPKILPCGHTFCNSCTSSFSGKCPTCRKNFSRQQVQKNFVVVNIINELSNHFSQAQEASSSSRRTREICKLHNSEIDQFCRTCMKLMCNNCECEHLHQNYTKHIISDLHFRHEVETILETYKCFEIKKKNLFNKVDKFIQERIQEVEAHAYDLIQKIKRDLDSTTAGIRASGERFKEQVSINRNLIDCRKSSFDDYVAIYKQAQEDDENLKIFLKGDFDFGLVLTQAPSSSNSDDTLPIKGYNVPESFFLPKKFCDLNGTYYKHSIPSCACFPFSANFCRDNDSHKFRIDLVVDAQTYKAH